jgi:hypothetical protein
MSTTNIGRELFSLIVLSSALFSYVYGFGPVAPAMSKWQGSTYLVSSSRRENAARNTLSRYPSLISLGMTDDVESDADDLASQLAAALGDLPQIPDIGGALNSESDAKIKKKVKRKVKTKTKSKTEAKAKGKGRPKSKPVEDNDVLVSTSVDTDIDLEYSSSTEIYTGQDKTSEMAPLGMDNLDKDLAELEADFGQMGEQFVGWDINEDSRSALESISQDDLRDALESLSSKSKGASGGGMDDFLSQLKIGDANTNINVNDDDINVHLPIPDTDTDTDTNERTSTSVGVGAGGLSTNSLDMKQVSVLNANTNAEADTESSALPVKRGRGRPKKVPDEVLSTSMVNKNGYNTNEIKDTSEIDAQASPREEFLSLYKIVGPKSKNDDLVRSYTVEQKELEDLSEDEFLALKAAVEREIEEDDKPIPLNVQEKGWYPKKYNGGKPQREPALPVGPGDNTHFKKNTGLAKPNKTFAKEEFYQSPADEPSDWRVQIVSVVTNSSTNSTALDMVDKVYDYIKKGTDNDPRIQYQTICYTFADGEPFDELEDSIQMWLESYNTYHLIDGAAMKEVWGGIMPHIVLGEHNLEAVLDRVKYALVEDTMGGAILTPRLRRVRLRGGASEMKTGFNTEHLDSEFAVVSVR